MNRHRRGIPLSTAALLAGIGYIMMIAVLRLHSDTSTPQHISTIQCTPASLFLFTADEQRSKIIDLVNQCNQIVYADKAVIEGSAQWERVFRWRDVEQYRDGITLTNYGMSPHAASLLYTLPIPIEKAVLRRMPKGGYEKQLTASPKNAPASPRRGLSQVLR
jgi:hypothetical protein